MMLRREENKGADLGAHDVLLRRGIARVQQILIGDIVDPHSQVCSSSQVDELDLVVGLADDDILGLHISVHDACAVGSLQSFQQLQGTLSTIAIRQHVKLGSGLIAKCRVQSKAFSKSISMLVPNMYTIQH